jgi:hypothetical protein
MEIGNWASGHGALVIRLIHTCQLNAKRSGRLETASTQTCVERSRNTQLASVGFKT